MFIPIYILIGFLLGVGLCALQAGLSKSSKDWDGVFKINATNGKDEILELNLSTDLDELKSKGYMEVKVEVQ